MGRGRDRDEKDLDPLSDYLIIWFRDLNECRRFNVIVSLGGGGTFPEALTHLEILAWAQLTGNTLSPWEVKALRAMDQAWCKGYGERKGRGAGQGEAPAMQHQALGEYCKGEKVEECRKLFGSQLDKICATCPN